jgi:replicative DNA helicase
MKKDFLNACYKFMNRFITSEELIQTLKKINKNELKELIKEIENITNNTPNDEDEYIKKEKETIKKLIKRLETIPKEKNEEFLNKQLENLKKDYNKKRDSKERWFKITEYINENEIFNKYFDELSDYELLEFIAQYIKASFPPQLNQKEFENLVKAGIEKDEREWLWRLAFNYENKNINFDSITNYFIKIKDGYYLSELISAVGENLNIDNIIDNINDNELIKDLKNRKNTINTYVSEDQINKLMNKLEKD